MVSQTSHHTQVLENHHYSFNSRIVFSQMIVSRLLGLFHCSLSIHLFSLTFDFFKDRFQKEKSSNQWTRSDFTNLGFGFLIWYPNQSHISQTDTAGQERFHTITAGLIFISPLIHFHLLMFLCSCLSCS
jgi:hypothetical protein